MSKERDKRKLRPLALFSVLALVLLICSVAVVDRFIYPSLPDAEHERKTLWFDGVSYFPRQDIRTYLLMGIDRSGPAVDSGYHRNDGVADALLLLVFDETSKEYTVLALNRDTMADVPVLGFGGKSVGTIHAQLGLAHTYGNGLHQSCENTKSAVSNLLCGAPIHQYISMNMDVISILTDAVGGVEVTVQDDFSMLDESIQKGNIVLNGEQAYWFLRARKDVGDQLNVSRMSRHEEFIRGFIDAFQTNIGKDVNKAMAVYDSISPYIVTDCSDQVMTELIGRFYDYKFVDVLHPEGTNVTGDEFMEFYLEEEKYYQLVLSLLFSPKNQ